MFALAACNGDDAASSGVVDTADAIAAMVTWQAEEQEPVLDDNGEAQLPVIFVVAGDGADIDVGVQASVAEAMVDTATVRFADDVDDTFDSGFENQPVRDDGVLLLVGPMPDAAETITIDLDRYEAVDEWETLQLEITAGTTDDSDGSPPLASVTSVTQL